MQAEVVTMDKSLPILDQINVASPCHVNWDDMTGDDRARFCSQCKLNVYDLSAMSRDEATAFVSGREGRTCVRYYRRHDGTILTRDCPVGLRAGRKRLTRAVAALAGVLVALIGGTLFGSRANRLMPEGFRSPSDAFTHWVDPQPEFEAFMLGVMVCPPPPGPPVGVMAGESIDEPAESPLPPPTPEQLDVIQERLTQ
jgi:hypothetical protein